MGKGGISREGVLRALAGRGRPRMTSRALLRALGARAKQTRELSRLLRQLAAQGEVERVAGGWRLPRRDRLVEGIFTPADGPGSGAPGGSVVDDAGRVWQVADGGGSQAGERVLVQPLGRSRAEWVGVIEGARSEWIGIFHPDPEPGGRLSSSRPRSRFRERPAHRGSERGVATVTPFRDAVEWELRIAAGQDAGAAEGDVVVVKPTGRGRLGRVVEVLGRPDTPEARTRAVVWRRRLPVEFPSDALAEVRALSETLPPPEIARRVDLRDRLFVTIDPATARDHDDALCVEAIEGDATRLWVAIADVSHYVPAGSALDREALRRGNSVYFPDRAIPMLPERLSGDLCSLRPDVDRLAMVVELVFDRRASPLRRSFYPAVVRSRARLDYATAARAMQPGAVDGLAPAVVGMLRELEGLAARLTRRRLQRGAIDFALAEPAITLDADGRPLDIQKAARTPAHRAVEEAMLAANRSVSSALDAAGVPAIYRIHEPPAADELDELEALLADFGLLGRGGGRRAGGGLTPADIARALQRAAGRPEEQLVRTAALRAMRQARYDAADRGHFALAFDSYCHFTSPIRRYADLVVHRALKAMLDGSREARGARPDPARADAMRRVAARVSWRERVAVDAEREMLDLVKCAFMRPHVGEEFDGVVSGVARHGLYVTLDRHFVEGLVRVASLRGFYDFDERRHALVERRSRRTYRLGDRVRVVVAQVDLVRAWLDLEPVFDDGDRAPDASGPRRRGRSGGGGPRDRSGRRRPGRPGGRGRSRERRRGTRARP